MSYMVTFDDTAVIGTCGICGQELHWIYNRAGPGSMELRSKRTGVVCQQDRRVAAHVPYKPGVIVKNGEIFAAPHRLVDPEMLKDPQAVERWLADDEE